MDGSILNSIKEMCGIENYDDAFDTELIILINSMFPVLAQLGVGLAGFRITDASSNWSDFISTEDPNFSMAQVYIRNNVRLLFDAPSSSAMTSALNEKANEFAWRMALETDLSELPSEEG